MISWNKIKQFFAKLFGVGKKDSMLPEGIEKTDIKSKLEKEEFRVSLVISTEPQDSYIVKLQQDFEDGKIKEEDMSKEDRNKLRELYNEQIETIKKSIKLYKDKIIRLKKE